MHYINTSYTIYYNVQHKRCGHVFQGRFKSILVEADSYFSKRTRYIHLNPVRAKIVDSPEKYPWSSYNAYIAKGPGDFIDKNRVKELMAMDICEYREFVLGGIRNPSNPFKNVDAGFMLGGVNFIRDKLNLLQREVETKDFAYKRAVRNIIAPQKIIDTVAGYFKLEPQYLLKSYKRPMTAKKIALYLLRRKTGLTNAQIGELFNMKFSAVSKAALTFEKEMAADKSLVKAVDWVSSKFEV